MLVTIIFVTNKCCNPTVNELINGERNCSHHELCSWLEFVRDANKLTCCTNLNLKDLQTILQIVFHVTCNCNIQPPASPLSFLVVFTMFAQLLCLKLVSQIVIQIKDVKPSHRACVIKLIT